MEYLEKLKTLTIAHNVLIAFHQQVLRNYQENQINFPNDLPEKACKAKPNNEAIQYFYNLKVHNEKLWEEKPEERLQMSSDVYIVFKGKVIYSYAKQLPWYDLLETKEITVPTLLEEEVV